MRRLLLVLLALTAVLPGRARAGDPPPEAKVEEARARLAEVLCAEEKLVERTQAVAELAAIDKPAAAKALVEALDTLARRSADFEARAARTRQDYERYKGSAQSTDKDWAMKQRLHVEMERQDAVLRNDQAVFDAFVAAIAGMAQKDAVLVLDRAVVKDELAPARRVLFAGLLRNKATNARDVAKRAAADPDATVRLAAVQAYAQAEDVGLAEFAIKALAEPNWAFRQAAARALCVVGDSKAVGPLVTAMAAEEGRLLEDYADALAKLTGAKLGPNPEAWKRWYDDHKAELAAKGAPPAAPKLGKGALTAPVDYYGIQTRSLKLLFLIDCSGSMNEKIALGGTSGDGPKIAIAKKMLKAAIMQLQAGTLFNVITFNTDARAMNPGLIAGTAENKALMCGRVDELGARGGTWTYGALKLAFGLTDANVTPTSPPVDTIFVLSDGEPTEATFEEGVEAKPMDPAKILASVHQWNPFQAVKIHAIAIDPRIEKSGRNFIRFMRDLAGQNGGSYTAIGSQ
jgi:hypothetical protein